MATKIRMPENAWTALIEAGTLFVTKANSAKTVNVSTNAVQQIAAKMQQALTAIDENNERHDTTHYTFETMGDEEEVILVVANRTNGSVELQLTAYSDQATVYLKSREKVYEVISALQQALELMPS